MATYGKNVVTEIKGALTTIGADPSQRVQHAEPTIYPDTDVIEREYEVTYAVADETGCAIDEADVDIAKVEEAIMEVLGTDKAECRTPDGKVIIRLKPKLKYTIADMQMLVVQTKNAYIDVSSILSNGFGWDRSSVLMTPENIGAPLKFVTCDKDPSGSAAPTKYLITSTTHSKFIIKGDDWEDEKIGEKVNILDALSNGVPQLAIAARELTGCKFAKMVVLIQMIGGAK